MAGNRGGWIVAFGSLVTPSGVVSREESVSVRIANLHQKIAWCTIGGSLRNVHVVWLEFESLIAEDCRLCIIARGRSVCPTPPAGTQQEPTHNRHVVVVEKIGAAPYPGYDVFLAGRQRGWQSDNQLSLSIAQN